MKNFRERCFSARMVLVLPFLQSFCDELRFTSAFTCGMLKDVLHRWDRRQIEVLADAARTGE
jgi:hypothetical protein